MSGHSKWSKIKRKKGATDARRSKAFSRANKEITIAVKEGNSGDPGFNPRLRLAISNAKGVNMPKDTIDRAIKKALDSGGESFTEVTYEGYAPGGIAVFVECATDNLNRTVSHIRAAFNKYEGNLATTGSVDFLFERKGLFVLASTEVDLDEVELELIDGGAEDIEPDEENRELIITVAFEDFGQMQKKLEDLSLEPISAVLERLPTNSTEISEDEVKKVLRLIEALEDLEDVQNVFHNMEISEETALNLLES